MGGDRNKLIDGWRGLSVLLVVIGHVVSYRFLAYWDIRPLHDVVGSPGLLIENIMDYNTRIRIAGCKHIAF